MLFVTSQTFFISVDAVSDKTLENLRDENEFLRGQVEHFQHLYNKAKVKSTSHSPIQTSPSSETLSISPIDDGKPSKDKVNLFK